MSLRQSYCILKNLHFRPKGSMLHGFCQWTPLILGENFFVYAKILNFFNFKIVSPPFWKIIIFLPKWSILVAARGMLLKCGENCFILEEAINFFEIQDGSLHHLEFSKICPLDSKHRCCFVFGMRCWTSVKIASYLRKTLTFFEIQDGGRRRLGFCKICILALSVDIG